ncbi:hypothetical protein AB0L88_13110 [Saccharopolyspora shandongensis]
MWAVGVGHPAQAWKVIAMDKKSNLLIIVVAGVIAIGLLFVAVSVG